MTNPLTPFRTATRALALLALLLSSFAALVGTASAEPPPLVTEPEFEWPGDLLPIPSLPGLDLLGVMPTAEAAVNCETNSIDVQTINSGADYHWVDVWANDDLHHSELLVPGGGSFDSIAASENETVHVEVSVVLGSNIFEADVTFDCVFPEPAYEILTDCDTGQAHARLINHGDDTAYIGVQYPDVMHMEIEILPHSSEDWLLAVDPGESIGFEIKASDIVIGTEHLDFDCELPITPVVEPTPEPTPVPPVTPDPGGADASEGSVTTDSTDLTETSDGSSDVSDDGSDATLEVEADTDIDADDAAAEVDPDDSSTEDEASADVDADESLTEDEVSADVTTDNDELAAGLDVAVVSGDMSNTRVIILILVGLGLVTAAIAAAVTIRRQSV